MLYRLASYLDHGNHAIIASWVSTYGEVARGVSTDDPVDGVPVRRMWLVGIYHCQISHRNVYAILWDLARKLQRTEKKVTLRSVASKCIL